MSTAATFVATPKLGLVQIVEADTDDLKTLITAGASGSKIVSLLATNDDDNNSVFVQFVVTRSAVDYVIAQGSVGAGAGAVDGFGQPTELLGRAVSAKLPIDNDGQSYLFLQSGDVLKVRAPNGIASGKTLTVMSVHGDF